MVLENYGEDELRRITQSQGENERLTIRRRKTDRVGHILCNNCLIHHIIEGNTERKVREEQASS